LRNEDSLKVLVGWGLGGASFTARSPVGARLGEPTWGPNELLRDLELRLALPRDDAPPSLRIPRWHARIAALADAKAFYAKSFSVDALGTAQTLLAWRDALVEAGWDGAPIPGGGDRLDALAHIEGHKDEELPPGTADRLVRVERTLRECRSNTRLTRLYDELSLVEPRPLWSQRWQRIFALIEALGTRVVPMHLDFPGAPAETDLGRLQRMFRGDRPTKVATVTATSPMRGDGSLLLLHGETLAELAELTAALLVSWRDGALLVRSLDTAPLEAALLRHGLPGQGYQGSSGWRPAMQVLPLALELAYEPRDPFRVLELLTLPIGPFQGLVGSMLARAVSKQPGVGGQEWRRQKVHLTDILRDREARKQTEAGKADADALAAAYVADRMRRVEEWLESPGAGKEGATRESLLALTGRVRRWLQKRLATGDPDVYGAAFAQAQALTHALTHEARAALSREDVRHLLDTVVRASHGHSVTVERAGRVHHVAHPSALLAPAASVVFWGFVAGTERRPAAIPWNHTELKALEAAGVVVQDPGALLSAESDAWRRAVLAARERVVFVVPSKVKGAAMSHHPMWDEIRARLGLEDESSAAGVTHHAQRLLQSEDAILVPVERLPHLPLPEGRAEWTLAQDLFAAADDQRGTSATALTMLVSCPLAWILERRAKLRSGAIAKVADGPLLNGNLSHRLVEELFRESAFDSGEAAFAARAGVVLETLIHAEGATLLLPGSAFERAQLVRQILRAMRALHRYLKAAGFRIAAVEEPIETESAIGTLHGRIDVRLVDQQGNDAVLDLKWGASSHRDLLTEGRAVQLAAYARALGATKRGVAASARTSVAPFPPAAYFAISQARVLTADPRMKAPETLEGPALEETWRAVERTALTVVESLRQGRMFVAATKRALPLLKALDVPEADHAMHFASEGDAPCKYCAYPAICGRAWEDLE
jgi:ATP-dependent helicase/nuclease subunit B